MTSSHKKRSGADPPCLSRAEITAARARWRGELPPDLHAQAEALLARISPPRWSLEWSLPRWLGDALQAPTPLSSDLVMGNVYGLAYIRLTDDLMDGDGPPETRAAGQLLASALHQCWLDIYIRLFGNHPIFWERFECYLEQWRRAALASAQPMPAPLSAFTAEDYLALAHRGAALKVCAAGACIQAARLELLPQIEALLDELLTAAVLLDHALDWDADLAAGRPNALVAHVTAQSQIPAHRDALRQAMLHEFIAGKATRPYFSLIRARLRAAALAAGALGITGLAAHIVWLDSETARYTAHLADTWRREFRGAAAELLFISAQPAT